MNSELVDENRSQKQWRRHTMTCQGKCPGRNTSALVAALAVKSGNNKIKYQDILAALADATDDLSVPCHEHRTGAATAKNVHISLRGDASPMDVLDVETVILVV